MALNDLKAGTTLNVGVVHGGTVANVVAARAWPRSMPAPPRSAHAARVEQALHVARARDRRDPDQG